MLFEQVTEPQNGAFVRQARGTGVKAGKFTVQRYVMQGHFQWPDQSVQPIFARSECAASSAGNGERPPLVPVALAANGCIKPTSSVNGATRFISSMDTRLLLSLVTSTNPDVGRVICIVQIQRSTGGSGWQGWQGFADVS